MHIQTARWRERKKEMDDGWMVGWEDFLFFSHPSYQLLLGLAFYLIDPAFVTETTSKTN